MILIISFKSPFKVNEVNSFPALTVLFSLIFLSNLFILFEIILLTNPGKLSLVIGIARSVINFLPKLPRQKPRDPLDLFSIFQFY